MLTALPMTSSLAGLPTLVPSLTLPQLTPAMPTARPAEREATRVDQYGGSAGSPLHFFRPQEVPPGGLRWDPATQQMIAPPADGGAATARNALRATAEPATSHPMMQYTADVRRRLAREGLPTDANGVRMVALAEMDREHGPAVVRAMAGPAALARGARVELPPVHTDAVLSAPLSPEAAASLLEKMRASRGQAGLKETLRAGLDDMASEVGFVRDELRALHQATPEGAPTSIANLARGATPTDVGTRLANAVIGQGNEAPLLRDHNARLVAEGKAPLDLTKPADQAALRTALIEQLNDAAGTGPGRAQLDAARGELATEVAAARKKGILLMASTGNAHRGPELPSGADRTAIHGTPGIVFVGAADIGQPRSTRDDKTAGFSSDGAHVTGPGVRMPVGTPTQGRRPADWEGTSFSSPYVAGVAALMVRANPKITPDQLEQALLRSARDDTSTTRDGAGLVDPVAAVRAARALAVGR